MRPSGCTHWMARNISLHVLPTLLGVPSYSCIIACGGTSELALMHDFHTAKMVLNCFALTEVKLLDD